MLVHALTGSPDCSEIKNNKLRYNANCSLALDLAKWLILVSIYRSVNGRESMTFLHFVRIGGDMAQLKVNLGHTYHFRILSPIYRLLVLLSVSTLMATICLALSPDALIENGSKYLSDNTIAQYSVRRQYKFYNHCSAKQILIVGSSVTASGNQDSPNSILILQSAHYKNHHGIQIIGATSGRYLCFSKKSKLITKFSGSNPRCIFEELFSPDYYTVLRSVFNKDWLVGFNRRGKPILGSETKSHRSRCYHFTKRDHSYLDALHKTRHYSPKISNPHKLMHQLHEKRTRRQKRHAFTEMRR